MHKGFLVVVLFCWQLIALGQHVAVGGVVRDPQGLPLPGASLVGRTGATASQADGSFSMQLFLPDTVVVRQLGYRERKVVVRQASDLLVVVLEPIAVELGEVVVTAGRFEQNRQELTVSLEVLKPYLVQEKSQLKLEESLQQLPGVNLTDGQANIRSGSGWSYGAGSRVLVLVDDLPLISPDANQVQWNLIPMEAMQQVEVLKGASSALYGSAALNGIIHLRTRQTSDQPETRVSLFGSTYDSPKRSELKWWKGSQMGTGLQVYHSQKVGTWTLTGSLQGSYDQGYKWGEEESRARVFVHANTISDKIKGLEYGMRGSVLQSNTGDALIWQGMDQAYIPLDSSATRTTGTDYFFDPYVVFRQGKGVHRLHGRLLGINNRARDLTTNFDNASIQFYGEYQYQHVWSNLVLVTGLSGTTSNSNSEIFQGRHQGSGQSLFAQADYRFKRFNFSLGGRWEAYALDQKTFNRPVFRAGVNTRLAKATNLRLSAGQGFRFPSMAEVFTFTNVGAIYVYPNEELQPEEGWTAELGLSQGLKWGDFALQADLVGFWMEYQNMMEFSFSQWDPIPGVNPLGFGFKSVNVGPTRIRGLEFTLQGKGNIGPVDLQLLAGYSWMNPQPLNPSEAYATNGVGNPITYINSSSDTSGVLKYRYRQLFKWDVQANYKRLKVGMSLRYNDFMQNIDYIFESPLIDFILPGIGIKSHRQMINQGDWIADFRLGWVLGPNWEVGAAVNNAFNREYAFRPADLAPPRQWVLRITYQNF